MAALNERDLRFALRHAATWAESARGLLADEAADYASWYVSHMDGEPMANWPTHTRAFDEYVATFGDPCDR